MFGFLPSIGPWELILILAIALIIFGPGKLPEVGKAMGRGLREFKNSTKEVVDQVNAEADSEEESSAANKK